MASALTCDLQSWPNPNRSFKPRRKISFRSVNRCGSPKFDPELQRHHLLPCQLLRKSCFGTMFDKIGRYSIGFDDFRVNGLLLPSTDEATVRTGMPLHRGPHKRYNEMVIERVGQIERCWSQTSLKHPVIALENALLRLSLLQSALRRRLLDERKRMTLNTKDPLGTGFDFTELDQMAETLWQAH